MSQLVTNKNVPFMPGKLVDSELALWYACIPDGGSKAYLNHLDAFGIPKGGRLTVNKETGINGIFLSSVQDIFIYVLQLFLKKSVTSYKDVYETIKDGCNRGRVCAIIHMNYILSRNRQRSLCSVCGTPLSIYGLLASYSDKRSGNCVISNGNPYESVIWRR